MEAHQIIVHGNESEKFAGLLNAEIRRPMTRGVLDPKEPDSLKMIREDPIAHAGRAAFPGPPKTADSRSRRSASRYPLRSAGAADALTYHEATLRQTLEELGFEPCSINEGLAVVYGELEDSNYTGIGISCGGGLLQRLPRPGLSVRPSLELFHP